MKKAYILIPIIAVLFLFPFKVNADERIKIFSFREKMETINYAIKNGILYICPFLENTKKEKMHIYKVDRKNLMPLLMTFSDAIQFRNDNALDPDFSMLNKKISISDNRLLLLQEYSSDSINTFSTMTIIDMEISKNFSSKKFAYISFNNFNYLYIDNKNQKLYLNCDYLENEFDGIYEKKLRGIYVYDVENDILQTIYTAKLNGRNEICLNPIRIPNTEYLLFFGYSNVINAYIQEIPEWKAEIEQQRKNKKLYPNAKKFFIDGPANIRDNPRGKSIVYLNDWTEVLVLNQQGDWYEILYANIKGWTYKDNLRIGIKNE